MGTEPRPVQFSPNLTHDGELAWALFGGDDLQRGGDGLDADDRLVGVVSAGYGQFPGPGTSAALETRIAAPGRSAVWRVDEVAEKRQLVFRLHWLNSSCQQCLQQSAQEWKTLAHIRVKVLSAESSWFSTFNKSLGNISLSVCINKRISCSSTVNNQWFNLLTMRLWVLFKGFYA